MKPYVFLLIILTEIIFFSACDSETTTNFPTDIVQYPEISDSVFQVLLNDAKLICLNRYVIEEMGDTSKIEIAESHVAPIIAALQMVYLDTVSRATCEIKEYNVHTLCPEQLYQTFISVDTLSAPLASWLAYGFSGNSQLDDLITCYELQLTPAGKGQFVVFSKNGINQQALAAKLEKFRFIYEANAISCVGDGPQIEIINYSPDFINFVYSYGWGDCPSGCIYRHYWELGVCGGGFIESIGESGKKLP